jgi:hypothetical protein
MAVVGQLRTDIETALYPVKAGGSNTVKSSDRVQLLADRFVRIDEFLFVLPSHYDHSHKIRGRVHFPSAYPARRRARCDPG